MAFHHVAFGAKDIAATHEFYTKIMGFRLAKVVVAPTPGEHGGWARHVFYETGDDGQMIAFWDLHDAKIGTDWKADHAASLGLPEWVNHVAFDAPSLDALAARRRHWQQSGLTVLEIDHEWCTSIYVVDPNGILVEFCCTTRAFTEDEIAEAARLVADPSPRLETPAQPKVHKPLTKAGVAA
jgi:catechol 2,3-dioxygenase-like lactoylglutathione lyase family enzyme